MESVGGTYTSNSATTSGGAIYNAANASIALSSAKFGGSSSSTYANHAKNYGGAIYNAGTLAISNSRFNYNYAGTSYDSATGFGGAIFNESTGSITALDGTFTGNKAAKGGAIYTTNGVTVNGGTTFTGNIASEGAAIYSEAGVVNLLADTGNITFTNNNSTGTVSGTGSGIYSGAGLLLAANDEKYISLNDRLAINGTVQFGNSTVSGGTVKMGTNVFTSNTIPGSVEGVTFNTIDIVNDMTLDLGNSQAGDIINITNKLMTTDSSKKLSLLLDYDPGATTDEHGTIDKILLSDTVTATNISGSPYVFLEDINIVNPYTSEQVTSELDRTINYISQESNDYTNYDVRNNIKVRTTTDGSIAKNINGVIYRFTPADDVHRGLLNVNISNGGYLSIYDLEDYYNKVVLTESFTPIVNYTADKNKVNLTIPEDDTTTHIVPIKNSIGVLYGYMYNNFVIPGEIDLTKFDEHGDGEYYTLKDGAGDYNSVAYIYEKVGGKYHEYFDANAGDVNGDLAMLASGSRSLTVEGVKEGDRLISEVHGYNIDDPSIKHKGINISSDGQKIFKLKNIASYDNFTDYALSIENGSRFNDLEIENVTFKDNDVDIINNSYRAPLKFKGTNVLDVIKGDGHSYILSGTTTIKKSINQSDLVVDKSTLLLDNAKFGNKVNDTTYSSININLTSADSILELRDYYDLDLETSSIIPASINNVSVQSTRVNFGRTKLTGNSNIILADVNDTAFYDTEIYNNATLRAVAGQLGGSIKNAGKLYLSGRLDKIVDNVVDYSDPENPVIMDGGTTYVNGNLEFQAVTDSNGNITQQAGVAGTLDMQDSANTLALLGSNVGYSVGTLKTTGATSDSQSKLLTTALAQGYSGEGSYSENYTGNVVASYIESDNYVNNPNIIVTLNGIETAVTNVLGDTGMGNYNRLEGDSKTYQFRILANADGSRHVFGSNQALFIDNPDSIESDDKLVGRTAGSKKLSAQSVNWSERFGDANWNEHYEVSGLKVVDLGNEENHLYTGDIEFTAKKKKETDFKGTDTLRLVNALLPADYLETGYDESEREFKADVAGSTYKVSDALYNETTHAYDIEDFTLDTTVGTVTVDGNSDYENNVISTLDMNNKGGFTVNSDDTTLNIKNLKVENMNDAEGGFIKLNSGTVNLENVVLAATYVVSEVDTPYANAVIRNNSVTDEAGNYGLNLKGTNNLGAGVAGAGTTNVLNGETTVDSIAQSVINISNGAALVVDGGTLSATNGVANAGTLTLNDYNGGTAVDSWSVKITGDGTTQFKGTTDITLDTANTGTEENPVYTYSIANNVEIHETVDTTDPDNPVVTGVATLTAKGEQLLGNIFNAGKLKLSGKLDKEVKALPGSVGTGVTEVNGTLTFAKNTDAGTQAGVEGTLDMGRDADNPNKLILTGSNVGYSVGKVKAGTKSLDPEVDSVRAKLDTSLTKSGVTMVANTINSDYYDRNGASQEARISLSSLGNFADAYVSDGTYETIGTKTHHQVTILANALGASTIFGADDVLGIDSSIVKEATTSDYRTAGGRKLSDHSVDWTEKFGNAQWKDVYKLDELKVVKFNNQYTGDVEFDLIKTDETDYSGVDTLRLVNALLPTEALVDDYDEQVREFIAGVAGSTYKVSDTVGAGEPAETLPGTLGITVGTLTVDGNSDYENNVISTLDMNNKGGFTVNSDDTTLNIKNLKVENMNDAEGGFIKLNSGTVNLENVVLAATYVVSEVDTPYANAVIRNNSVTDEAGNYGLNLRGTNNLGVGIDGSGTTNVLTGHTTLAKINQTNINILKDPADGAPLTTLTVSDLGNSVNITNDSILELYNYVPATLAKDIKTSDSSAMGTTQFTGTTNVKLGDTTEIDNHVEIASTAQLKANAEQLLGNISNAGRLYLSGELNKTVNNLGTDTDPRTTYVGRDSENKNLTFAAVADTNGNVTSKAGVEGTLDMGNASNTLTLTGVDASDNFITGFDAEEHPISEVLDYQVSNVGYSVGTLKAGTADFDNPANDVRANLVTTLSKNLDVNYTNNRDMVANYIVADTYDYAGGHHSARVLLSSLDGLDKAYQKVLGDKVESVDNVSSHRITVLAKPDDDTEFAVMSFGADKVLDVNGAIENSTFDINREFTDKQIEDLDAVKWTDRFGTFGLKETYKVSSIGVVDLGDDDNHNYTGDVEFNLTKTEEESFGLTDDTLRIMNTLLPEDLIKDGIARDPRSFTANAAGETYKVADKITVIDEDDNVSEVTNFDLGVTESGTFTIDGISKESTLDMNGKGGFTVAKADTTLNIRNLQVTNVKDELGGFIKTLASAGENSSINLKNVDIVQSNTETSKAISNVITLNLEGTNDLGNGVVGEGTTNVVSGKTTVGSIKQSVINIFSGDPAATLKINGGTISAGTVANGGILELFNYDGSTADTQKDLEQSIGNNGTAVGTTQFTGTTNVRLGADNVINNNVEVNAGAKLRAAAEQLKGTIKNAGTLALSGTLDKTVNKLNDVPGTTEVDGALTFAQDTTKGTQAEIKGTLDMGNNANTLTLTGSKVNYSVDKVKAGNKATNVRANLETSVTKVVETDPSVEYHLDLVANTIRSNNYDGNNARVGLSSLVNIAEAYISDGTYETVGTETKHEIRILANADGTRAEFGADKVLDKASTFKDTYEAAHTGGGDILDKYNVKWTDLFGNAEWTDTYKVKDLVVVDLDDNNEDDIHNYTGDIRFTLEKTAESDYSGTDTLRLVNALEPDDFVDPNLIRTTERTFTPNNAGDTYVVRSTDVEDLGETVGTFTVNGNSDYENNKISTLDMNGKKGFTASDKTTALNIRNIKVTNIKDELGGFISSRTSNSNINLENVELVQADSETSNPILNVVTLNLTGDNKLANGINGTGTTNVNGGTTELKNIRQNNINITDDNATLVVTKNINALTSLKNRGTLELRNYNGGDAGTPVEFANSVNRYDDVQGTTKFTGTTYVVLNDNNKIDNHVDVVGTNATLKAKANNLLGSINNTGTLILSGLLKDKTVAGNGITQVDSNLAMAKTTRNTGVDGTLDLNNGTVDFTQDGNAANVYNIGRVINNGTIMIDADFSNIGAGNKISGDTIALTSNDVSGKTTIMVDAVKSNGDWSTLGNGTYYLPVITKETANATEFGKIAEGKDVEIKSTDVSESIDDYIIRIYDSSVWHNTNAQPSDASNPKTMSHKAEVPPEDPNATDLAVTYTVAEKVNNTGNSTADRTKALNKGNMRNVSWTKNSDILVERSHVTGDLAVSTYVEGTNEYGIKYDVTNVSNDQKNDKYAIDALAYLNQTEDFGKYLRNDDGSVSYDRSYITDDNTAAHTLLANIGETAQGKYTVQGGSDIAEIGVQEKVMPTNSKIYMNGHTGFELNNPASELLLENLHIKDVVDDDGNHGNFLRISSTAAAGHSETNPNATLRNVIFDNPYDDPDNYDPLTHRPVQNDGFLALDGRNEFNSGITGSGTTVVDKPAGSAGSITSLDAIDQGKVYVRPGARLIVRGSVGEGTSIENERDPNGSGETTLGDGGEGSSTTNKGDITGGGSTGINGDVINEGTIGTDLIIIYPDKSLTSDPDKIDSIIHSYGDYIIGGDGGTIGRDVIGDSNNGGRALDPEDPSDPTYRAIVGHTYVPVDTTLGKDGDPENGTIMTGDVSVGFRPGHDDSNLEPAGRPSTPAGEKGVTFTINDSGNVDDARNLYLADWSTLDLDQGTKKNPVTAGKKDNIKANIVIAKDDLAYLETDWQDSISSIKGIDSSIPAGPAQAPGQRLDYSTRVVDNAAKTGKLDVVSVNIANNTASATDASNDFVKADATNKDHVRLSHYIDLKTTDNDNSANYIRYNSNDGKMYTNRKDLAGAVNANSAATETTVYKMKNSEPASTTGAGNLKAGKLIVYGQGNDTVTDIQSGVDVGTTAPAHLVARDVNIKATRPGEAAITVRGGSTATIIPRSQDLVVSSENDKSVRLLAGGSRATLNVNEVDRLAPENQNHKVTIENGIYSDNKNNLVNFNRGTVDVKGDVENVTANVNSTLLGEEELRPGATRGGVTTLVTRVSGHDSDVTYNLNPGGTLVYNNDSTLYDPNYHTSADRLNTMNFNGGTLSTVNGTVTNFHLANMDLGNPGTVSNYFADVDLYNETMDKFTVSNPVTGSGALNVAGLNLISDSKNPVTVINFTDDPVLMAATNYTGGQQLTALAPIYKYDVSYNKGDGNFTFVRSGGGGNGGGGFYPWGGNSYNSYNPAVMVAPVAAQLGGYLAMVHNYDDAFRNMDMYMLMTQKERQAMKYNNKYASAATDSMAYYPGYDRNSSASGWVRPSTTFERVNFKNGPKVNNIAYSTFVGGESKMHDLGHGWDGMATGYVSYQGSHQSFDNVGMYQNGGTLGVVGMAYKGNFFTGLTAGVGASVVDADTMYGKEDFTMLMTGIASKTGYNFELGRGDNKGKFVIQPSLLISYSFIETFNYTNAAGVAIKSSGLHAIQLEPGIKFIANLKNGLQPYASVSMVWNFMDKTHFRANDVALPELSIDPFVKYGLGVRKTWGERSTGYVQAYATNGGRNGIGLQAELRWLLGRLYYPDLYSEYLDY